MLWFSIKKSLFCAFDSFIVTQPWNAISSFSIVGWTWNTNYPLFKSNCFFASDFRSFAGAPVGLDVLLHVLEVVLQLLNPVRSPCCSDRQLVPVVPDVNQDHNQGQSEESSGNTKKQPVDSISQVSCVRSFFFLLFSIPQTSLPCRKRNFEIWLLKTIATKYGQWIRN